GFLVEDEFARRVPGVDVALHVACDDLGAPVAEQITGGRRLEDRAVVGGRDLAAGEGVLAGVQRQGVGVHRPAGQVWHFAGVGVVLVGVDDAVGVGDDQLVGIVALEVHDHGAGVAVAAYLDG